MNKNNQFMNSALILNLMTVLLTSSISVWTWDKLPSRTQIPVHWNVEGEVDVYGSKEIVLLIVPLFLLFSVVLFSLLPRLDPRQKNLQQSQKTYRIIWGSTTILFSILHIIIVRASLGHNINIGVIMAYLMGTLLMVIGNYQGKIRSNHLLGIRTPWTLTSALAWKKTHRLGGYLFFLTGFFVFASGLFENGPLTLWILMIGLIASIVFLVGYSYHVWKRDINPGS